MSQMKSHEERAAERAREKLLDDKRRRIREILSQAQNHLSMLNDVLKCIMIVSERVSEDMCVYEITIDSRKLQADEDVDTKMIKDWYDEAVIGLSEVLREGAQRWSFICPFWFTIVDYNGIRLKGWMVSPNGGFVNT